MTTNPELIRGRMAELVEASGMQRGEIAEAAGISYDHLYQVLSGRRKDPSISTVASILSALGKKWADLD